jgi:hypothetical protein
VTAIPDPAFAKAVAAIDRGDAAGLDALVAQHPRLVRDRLRNGETGYFADPYLLWFIAENPIRNRRLPANIVDIARRLTGHVRSKAPESLQEQLDYTLGLVATGCVPRECGVQIALIDALVAEGARPGSGDASLGNREPEAAARLLHHGGPPTLATLANLHCWEEARALFASADAAAKADGLAIAGYLGDPEAIKFLLDAGADPNLRSTRIHRHSSALHQAALSGSLEAVKLLVAAGASLDARDSMWNGTPAGWANHGKHSAIESFLRAAR